MVQVKVSDGILEGEIVDNVLGGKYYSFKGIPYAEPPVGDLRFKAPQPPKPWSGIRDAKEHGPICCQQDLITKSVLDGKEDCLYLNIYTPEIKDLKLLPVMFLIHGGGFFSGSGNSDIWGPDFLTKKDVILVTFNYRLEVLGFLCLNTKDIPGNAGMKDQIAALRWVKKNISSFGGDPDNITIFGVSAGAASVAFHLVSPMTKGLFKRAIVQSGNNLSQWANSFEPRMLAECLAKSLGFYSTDDKELFEFFKSVPIEKLIGIRTPIITNEEAGVHLTFKFNIADEKHFDDNERYFFGDIYEKIHNNIHENVDIVIGHTTNDGVVICSVLDNLIENCNKYLQTFIPLPMVLECSIKHQLEVARKLKEYYLGKEQKITPKNADKLFNFFTIQLFAYDTVQLAKVYAKKNKCYFYIFDCFSERNVFTELFNAGYIRHGMRTVCHYDDVAYLFHIKDVPLNLNSKSFKMIQNITSLWTNFAKTGNPTPDNSFSTIWPVYDNVKQEYIHIGDELLIKSHPKKREIEFWNNLYHQYLPKKYHL